LKKKISDKDKKDWENFLSKNENLPNKDLNTSNIKSLNSKICDLHGYSLNEANKKIYDLILNSYKTGINKLIIVTGKGLHSENEKDPYISKDLGILKYSVPDYIRRNKELMSVINEIKDATLDDGGSGAFYIFLKKKLQNKF
jgi:DNA-nicking Smr family endonuclease